MLCMYMDNIVIISISRASDQLVIGRCERPHLPFPYAVRHHLNLTENDLNSNIVILICYMEMERESERNVFVTSGPCKFPALANDNSRKKMLFLWYNNDNNSIILVSQFESKRNRTNIHIHKYTNI